MKPGEYRREYAAYSSALARAQHDYHTGRTPALRLTPLHERYADLWTRAQLDELERAHNDTPTQFETERTALLHLIAAVRRGYAEVSAREVADELRRCEAAARVEWAGERLAAADVPDLIARESDATRRRELAARWLDASATCNDLRGARLEALRAAAAALGLASCSALFDETIQPDESSLPAAADVLLARTGATYEARLHAWAARHLPPTLARTPVYADSLFCARLAWLDQFFPAAGLPPAYDASMASLGIRTGQQTNLRVEWQVPSTRATTAAEFGIEPPADVRLVAGTQDGARQWRGFFRAAACAQQLAWVSRDLAARYPEFVHAPDAPTRNAYGFLFRHLFHDATWLAAHRGLKPSVAEAVARDFALVELHDTRRCCAQLRHQTTLARAPDVRTESIGAEYAAAHTEATGFQYEPAFYLRNGGAEPGRAAAELRARLFASALAEHLRARYGRRWWAARAAGDELIDLWNTGARYTVAELATLVGAGALDVELLADDLLAAVGAE
ncbi:MAG TPA: hypothetical protein VF525_00120 [Pyrinomonadaceae bacterium]